MHDAPRQALSELLTKHGIALCDDHGHLGSLLRDACPDHRREVFVLVNALREGVPQSILSSQGESHDVLLPRLSQQLSDQLALAEDAATWAVESWAAAIGSLTQMPLVVCEHGSGSYRSISEAVRVAWPGAHQTITRDRSIRLWCHPLPVRETLVEQLASE